MNDKQAHLSSKTKILDQFDNAAAYALFEEWFVKNYPGPHTVLTRPTWHAPKIWRQMLWALGMNEKHSHEIRPGSRREGDDAEVGCSDETNESAWLIEMAGDRAEPLYWHAEPDARCLGGFDPDANKAMRFCREKDARAMALMLGAKGLIALTDVRRVKITEHEWCSPLKAEPKQSSEQRGG